MNRYVVQKDDTLAKLAMRFYGDASLWTRIFDANRKSIRNPNLISAGQLLEIPSEMDLRGQRSGMSTSEQLRSPEEGLSYPVELEVLELLVGATALLKGLLKAGIKVFSKEAIKSKNAIKDVGDVFKAVVNPETGEKTFPNSPYKPKTLDPREAMANIEQKIQESMMKVDPHGVGRQNAEISRIHKEFIEKGRWPLKNKDLGDQSVSMPGPCLVKARQEYLKALNEHK